MQPDKVRNSWFSRSPYVPILDTDIIVGVFWMLPWQLRSIGDIATVQLLSCKAESLIFLSHQTIFFHVFYHFFVFAAPWFPSETFRGRQKYQGNFILKQQYFFVIIFPRIVSSFFRHVISRMCQSTIISSSLGIQKVQWVLLDTAILVTWLTFGEVRWGSVQSVHFISCDSVRLSLVWFSSIWFSSAMFKASYGFDLLWFGSVQ